MFITMIPAIWATPKCVKYIDYEKLNKWLVFGGVALLVLTVLNQNTLIALEYEEMHRVEGNAAMGSLNLGYTCVICFVFFLSWIVSHNKESFWKKAFLLFFMAISIIIMLRAASRGPFVVFVFIILFCLFSRAKNKELVLIVSIIALLFLWLNISTILGWLGNISPMLEKRMASTVIEGDTSGRESIFGNAISIFLENPVCGKQFVLRNGFYSHNSILDVMIGLGLLGALIWVYLIGKDFKFCFQNVMKKSSLMAISLISTLYIMEGFFSGAMYINHKLVICLIIVFSMSGKEMTSDFYK